MQVITVRHSRDSFSLSERMCDQEVESCDCVDEETECSDARVQGEERIQQVLSVAGNASEQFAVSCWLCCSKTV